MNTTEYFYLQPLWLLLTLLNGIFLLLKSKKTKEIYPSGEDWKWRGVSGFLVLYGACAYRSQLKHTWELLDFSQSIDLTGRTLGLF